MTWRSKKRLLILLLTTIMALCLAAQAAAAEQPRNLYLGCRGDDVAELQKTLNSLGYYCGKVDGIFGPRTYNAVVSLQKANNIKADGIVGPQTRRVIAALTANTSRSETLRYSKVLNMVATAYCPCDQCNYPYGGKPSYIGLPLGPGIAAVDPSVIPLGTRLYVEGYGYAIAADTGGAIKGNRIDLCFATHSQALAYGIKNVKVYILLQ